MDHKKLKNYRKNKKFIKQLFNLILQIMSSKYIIETPKMNEVAKKIMKANLLRTISSTRKGTGLDNLEKGNYRQPPCELGIKLSLPNEKDFNVLNFPKK